MWLVEMINKLPIPQSTKDFLINNLDKLDKAKLKETITNYTQKANNIKEEIKQKQELFTNLQDITSKIRK